MSGILQLVNTFPSGGFAVKNSLRFRSSASAYLSRTPASAGNQRTWTWSGWVKRGKLGVENALFHAPGTIIGVAHTFCYFTASDTLAFYDYTGSAYNFLRTSTQVFRDPSAWYHLVFVVDSNNATSQNRARIYVNGVEITSWSSNSTGSSGFNTIWNSAVLNEISSSAILPTTYYLDGYLAEVNFIDGQALTPSSFGAFDATSGVWQPTRYSGTYGTNGFYLKFSDTTSTTTLCYDYSGNSNNWTPNNISLTAGSTYDSMLDSPTNYDNGGNGVGNYAVLNPLNRTGSTFSDIDGNLNWTGSSTQIDRIYGTIGLSSGKWYWEVTMSGSGSSTYYFWIGIAKGASTTSSYDSTGLGYWGGNDATITGKFNNRNTSTNTAYGASWTFGDVIGVALDMDSGTLTFYKNGASQGVAISTINSSYPGTYFPMTFSDGGASGSFVYSYNFGQRPFAYTPPTGYKALNTQNLPAPSIINGASYMAATTYTGTGASLSVSGAAFQPDLVWIKSRSAATDHALYDVIRGVQDRLESNTTDAEVTSDNGLTAFNSNGFTVNTLAQVNTNAATYIGWQWKAGGTAVTNTAGTITSQVSANTTAGFSVVTYTGNGVNGATVGHGLGVTPNFVIMKGRSTGAYNWNVYHSAVPNGYLQLNTTDGLTTTAGRYITPGSSVLTLTSYVQFNENGTTQVAYCFAAIAGYSAFGSYTGNGSSDGPFVFLGFRPRYVLIKRTDTSGNSWTIKDTSRDTYNQGDLALYAEQAIAESGSRGVDYLSNGFKVRNTSGDTNASGGTYVYAAFAENPLKYSLAR